MAEHSGSKPFPALESPLYLLTPGFWDPLGLRSPFWSSACQAAALLSACLPAGPPEPLLSQGLAACTLTPSCKTLYASMVGLQTHFSLHLPQLGSLPSRGDPWGQPSFPAELGFFECFLVSDRDTIFLGHCFIVKLSWNRTGRLFLFCVFEDP